MKECLGRKVVSHELGLGMAATQGSKLQEKSSRRTQGVRCAFQNSALKYGVFMAAHGTCPRGSKVVFNLLK